METLGRYQIVAEIGRGGCGKVYSAIDPRIGRKVAIKTIDGSATPTVANNLHERFRREARAAGGLSHPNIVTIHEFDDTGEITFLVMEFVDGRTLADWMSSGEPISTELIFSALRAAADALDFAHAQNIIHRDVKPANFLITSTGVLKVADFGIAKIEGDIGLTNTGMVIGTAQYMSPEQVAARPVTGRSDQFSLAVIAYEMLTGQKPFQGDSWASLLHQIMAVDPPPVSTYRQDLGEDVTAALLRALAKDPAQRYATCREFIDRLAESVGLAPPERTAVPLSSSRVRSAQRTPAEEQDTVAITSEAGGGRHSGTRRSRAIPLTFGGIGIAIAAAAGAWWFTHRSVPPAPAPAPQSQIAGTKPADLPKPEVPAAGPEHAPVPKTRPAETKRVFTAPPSRPEPQPAQPETPKPQMTSAQTPPAQTTLDAPPKLTTVTAPPPVAAQTPTAAPPKPTDAELWDRLKNSSDSAALDQFRRDHPGPFAAEAARRIEQLDWDRAQRGGDARSFRDYLAKYPAGAFADRANAEIARLDKARDAAAQKRMVDDALARFRDAFQRKDIDALKSIWTGLSRSEINSFQNFFRIARTINVELRPLGDPVFTNGTAAIRCRRIVSASDDRGPMPTQDQIVNIRMRRSGDAMVIEAVEVGR